MSGRAVLFVFVLAPVFLRYFSVQALPGKIAYGTLADPLTRSLGPGDIKIPRPQRAGSPTSATVLAHTTPTMLVNRASLARRQAAVAASQATVVAQQLKVAEQQAAAASAQIAVAEQQAAATHQASQPYLQHQWTLRRRHY